jgi:CheY-like chemotaxis protein
VIEADSAEAALAALAADDAPLDALVADLNLPGRDGAALARELRADRPALPVVLVSGYGERAAGARATAGDDVSVLVKPYTLACLIETVHRALAR